jgi:hypothetical protein
LFASHGCPYRRSNCIPKLCTDKFAHSFAHSCANQFVTDCHTDGSAHRFSLGCADSNAYCTTNEYTNYMPNTYS